MNKQDLMEFLDCKSEVEILACPRELFGKWGGTLCPLCVQKVQKQVY